MTMQALADIAREGDEVRSAEDKLLFVQQDTILGE
jgi:hypothetical protein